MLVWLWLTSAALLLGAEVNAQTRQLVAERESARAGAPALALAEFGARLRAGEAAGWFAAASPTSVLWIS